MSVMEVMAAARSRFTPNDELIYQRVVSDPESVVALTTSVLAEQCGVSQPALTRFVKTLGYARYQDFRTDLVAWAAAEKTTPAADSGHLSHFAVVYQELEQLETLLTDDYLRELASYVRSFEHVYAVGITKSHHPAMLLEQLTIKTSTRIHAIEIGLLDEMSDALGERDLIIVFTISQRHPSLRVLQATSGKILVVTATPNGELSRIADRQVVFPSVTSNPEESAISPVMFSLFVELLTQYLALG